MTQMMRDMVEIQGGFKPFGTTTKGFFRRRE